jgi:uncharacterized protein YndB with AHSA1/START domain
MIDHATGITVTKTITVEAPQARAFEVFTEGMSTWWTRESHHIGEQVPEAVVIEPRPGGRWFERAPNGAECDWGRVLEWEPPGRVLFAWHLDPEFEYDPDPSKATEVEVVFVPEGPTTTRVELVHRGLEVHGDAGEAMGRAVGGPNGWSNLLAEFAAAAAG